MKGVKGSRGLGRGAGWTEGLCQVLIYRFVNACVLMNLESALCVPSLVNFYLYQPERRKGSQLSVSVFYMSVVEGSPWLGQPV